MRVFLCYASGDKPAVRQLAQRLREDGFDPWLDEERLLPGQDWDLEILSAVRAADVIIVCLSNTSVHKVGYVQKELRRVLDLAEHQPEGRAFVMPARLEDCPVPTRLRHWQYADLFGEGGYDRLRAGLQALSPRDTDPGPVNCPNVTIPQGITGWQRLPRVTLAILVVLVVVAATIVYWVSRPASVKSATVTQPPDLILPGMVRIPGGRFLLGRNGLEDASPAHEVTAAPFYIDRLPVTVAQYRAFASASNSAVFLDKNSAGQQDDWPVTRVTWDEASAYCFAQGKRLPTEAEWEFAARGSTGRLYPWGEQFASAAVNSLEAGIDRLEPVGFRPLNRSAFDVADLSGNVWQWCSDDFQPYPGGTIDFPIPPGVKVIRGGSYQADARHVTAVTRNLERPGTRSPSIGFRCAK